MNMKRNLALAGALKLSESKITEYKDKWFGSKKGENKEQCKTSTIIFGDGDIDCYDQLTGRYFKSSITKLNQAVNNINELLYNGDSVELEDFYSFLDQDTPDLCDDYVWHQRFGPVKLDLYSKLTDENKPVLVIDFDTRPIKRGEC